MQIKKLFLLCFITFSFLNAYAVIIPMKSAPVNPEKTRPVFSKVSVKSLEKILQRKLKFKEKLTVFLYNHKIIKAPLNNENELKGAALGKKSLIYALGGWLLVLLGLVLPIVGLLGLIAFAFSAVTGFKALKYKKGDTNATIGLVLSGLYVLLLIIGLVLLFSFFSLN